jgi:hypothetical protein
VGASFRDPAGFVFRDGSRILRQVNRTFEEEYQRFLQSGLYEDLVGAGLLLPHEDLGPGALARSPSPEGGSRVLAPLQLRFLSHPAEWTFSQLKEAARATLEIEERAMGHGMTLRDAWARNIQFVDGRPVLIDTLSFESYRDGSPWIPYRQFCEQFLAPLALAAYRDPAFLRWTLLRPEGVTLEFAGRVLPVRAKLRPGILVHLALHGRAIAKAFRREKGSGMTFGKGEPDRPMPRRAREGLLASLRRSVDRLQFEPAGGWAAYAPEASYNPGGFDVKAARVEALLRELANPERTVVLDLGTNRGDFAQIAARYAYHVLGVERDAGAAELAWRGVQSSRLRNVDILVVDLANPTERGGWNGGEVQPFAERAAADIVLALALVHHLALGCNVPLDWIADFFAGLGPTLIVEFVPKEDPQAQKLIGMREDIFADYTLEGFRRAFGTQYRIVGEETLGTTGRRLFVLERKAASA